MNTTTHLPSRRRVRAALAVQLVGVMLVALAAGCHRRAIIVQAPPATVIQNPAPATTIVQAAPAPEPTGRDVVVVHEAPPPPREEVAPPQPASQYVWIPGYWAWRDNRQEWVPGRWEIPPRTGATWVSPRWEQRGSDYVFVDGYWQ